MSWLTRSAAALAWLLAWIGRHGTRAVALSLFAGIALPPLATLMKPAFTPSLFALICLAFLRVDPGALRRRIARPGLVLAATAWMMVVTPLVCGLALVGFGLDAVPGLMVTLVFQAAAPPVVSSSALAALIGLDAALALATLLACAAAVPATATVFATLFLGPAMDISPPALGMRLLALLAGAAMVAALVRRVAGQDRIERQAERIDGLSVIALFVFAVAVMDGVVVTAIARPLVVAGLIALALATSLALGGVTALVFVRAGRDAAWTLALSAGLRNVPLVVAAAGGRVPELTWLYIAMAQFPVYLLPLIVKPLIARKGAPLRR